MSVISNFELLLKPIAPTGGPASEVARVAVQGYFLEISNLEKRDITMFFRTRTSVATIPPNSPNTELDPSNNVVVYDITDDNTFQTVMTSAGRPIPTQNAHYVSCIQLPAGQTASLALLPNVGALLGAGTFDLAIRGYTELLLNSDFTIDNSGIIFTAPERARVVCGRTQEKEPRQSCMRV